MGYRRLCEHVRNKNVSRIPSFSSFAQHNMVWPTRYDCLQIGPSCPPHRRRSYRLYLVRYTTRHHLIGVSLDPLLRVFVWWIVVHLDRGRPVSAGVGKTEQTHNITRRFPSQTTRRDGDAERTDGFHQSLEYSGPTARGGSTPCFFIS